MKEKTQFKNITLRMHKSTAKLLQEISDLYQFDGIKKITRSDHFGFAIALYAQKLKDLKLKSGDHIEQSLFGWKV